MADANHERVIASFYGNNGTETQVRGRVIQILFQNQRKIYELMTDSPVHFRIRDAEIKLEARRHTQLEYSLFVSAEQCAPETTTDTVHTKPVTQPQHNSHSHSHSQTPSRPSRYKKGDLVTLPVEEVHSGVINGTVGYTGRHNNMDVVEICADPNSTTYSVISKIRNKFEVPRFPDEQRLNAMKGFSLVVRSDAIIPNDFTTSSGDRNQISTKPFPETVGYAFHENPQPGNPPYNTHEIISNDSAFQNNDYCEVPQFPSESGNQECLILRLSNDDPIAVVTAYGELKGRFRVVKAFEGSYHIGIELDRPPPGSPAEWKTPDGVLHEKRIFYCRPGHGCLVHISRCVSRVQQRNPNVPLVSVESTLTGSPNLFDNSNVTITTTFENYPPLKDIKDILGQKKGIQGHMNSCYMDSSLFGMFAFSSNFDPLFLKVGDNVQYDPTLSIQRYNHVKEILKTRIVYPLRKSKFVRADQIMMLREELSNAGTIDGLMANEKDPEEFLKVLLHVLNAEPYIKLKQENGDVNAEYIYQIFSTKQPDVTLPTVQFLLEHSFKEHKIILDSVPDVLILQMPRFGKDFKLYPRIFPSLQLSLDNLTSTTFEPKCIFCTNDASFRCPNCEDIRLFYYKYVSVYFCDRCVLIVHQKRQDHKFLELKRPKGTANMPPAKMELFAVLTIETSHYVCFSRCKGSWVMFDSMADREGSSGFGRNIPRVIELPYLKNWLESPEKLLTWMASDRSKRNNPIPDYVDRITRDTYLCMYHSEQVSMPASSSDDRNQSETIDIAVEGNRVLFSISDLPAPHFSPLPLYTLPQPRINQNQNLEFPDNSQDISIDRFRDNLPSVEEFNREQLDPADPERYVETVQENVRVSKERINELFNLAHQKLEEKKLAMFESLDDYMSETNKRVADLLKTRAQFVKAMEDFDTTLNVNTANDAKVGIIKIVKENIIKVDKQIENLDIHQLEVIENTGDDNIKYPCYVSKISRKFRTPKWCSVDKGTALDQLYDPHSIAIDPAFNRMYLADHAMHRIQVFNCLGTYIETFSNAHISLPVYVSLVPSGLLVSSPSLKKLVSISKENGAFQGEKSFPQGLIGIDYDETTQLVYACTVDTHRLYCLDAELNIRNETQLESAIGATHLRNRLAVDCKVRNGEIYVLFPYRENPVHVFTLKGRLKRSMLTRDYLHLGFRLCLTQTGDMVVSDLSGMQVKIFSQEGDPVRMIGQNGEGKGRLYQPTGVAVTAEGLIVVCDLKPAFMLQAF